MRRELSKEFWRRYKETELFVSIRGDVFNSKTGKLRAKKSLNPQGYCQLTYKGKTLLIHRIVLESFSGIPEGYHVDHINRDKTDNRLCNLEAVSQYENTRRGDVTKNKELPRHIQKQTQRGYVYYRYVPLTESRSSIFGSKDLNKVIEFKNNYELQRNQKRTN